jgi:hypothetical protein
MNEEPFSESSLNLTLMQHSRDEDCKLQEVRAHLEVEPLQAWYYHISLNSCTLVILSQVDLAFGDEPETIYKSCYEIEYTSIFEWCSIPYVIQYYWLRSLIHRLFPNGKADYSVRTIRCILNFLQL